MNACWNWMCSLRGKARLKNRSSGNMQFEELYKVLSLLSEDEQYLIKQLFFEERTERGLAEELKIYHNAVHKRKNRILKKLKNILENL